MQIYERLNFNNPIQETDRFRSVGSGITLLLSVLKMKKSQWLFDNVVKRSGEKKRHRDYLVKFSHMLY